MRGHNGPQPASSFHHGLGVDSMRQPDHQTGHEGISRANGVLNDYFWRRSGYEVATIPERCARGAHGHANPRRMGGFRKGRTSFGDSLRIAGWVGWCLAGLQPGSHLANFVVIELEDIGANRQLHDPLWIGE